MEAKIPFIVFEEVDEPRINYLIHRIYTVQCRDLWQPEVEADIYCDMFHSWNGKIDDLIREVILRQRKSSSARWNNI